MKYYGKISHDKDLITKKYMEDNALQPSDVVDNTSSTATTAPLSANQGKILSDKITNLSNIGRFLSVWNCATGVPTSEPPGLVSGQTYAYKTGDYFRVGTAGYRVPTSDGYTVGGTNYTTITELVNVGDVYYYDGTSWMKQASSGGGTVQDVTVDGTSVLSGGIAAIDLATPLGTKQDKLTSANAGDNITITEGGSGHNLPTGYTELEYIEGDGSAYINTGFKVNQDTAVEISFVPKETPNNIGIAIIYGTSSSWTDASFGFYKFSSWYSDYKSDNALSISLLVNTKHKLYKNKNLCYVDDTLAYTHTEVTFQATNNLLIGKISISQQYGSYAQYYACKIWDNGTLVRYLIPAKNASDTVGMYDIQNNVFYTNVGTGAFTAGPQIIPVTTINALSGLTATVTELNTLDGITATTSELNTLHGTTEYTAAEIDTLWESIT